MRTGLVLFCLLFLPWSPLHAGETDEDRQLFEIRYGMCHQLPEPDTLKPAQWRGVCHPRHIPG